MFMVLFGELYYLFLTASSCSAVLTTPTCVAYSHKAANFVLDFFLIDVFLCVFCVDDSISL